MSNKFNPSLLSFSVYETKKGEMAIRLVSPPSRVGGFPFSHCGYLTGADGDFLFSTHPILGPKWEAAKAQLKRAQAKVEAPTYIQAQPAPVQTQTPEVKRGPGRPKGSKTRISADDVQAQPAPVKATESDMEARMARIEAALLALVG